MTVSEGVRIDKWLWAARFFKTRALAREAVSGGKVHLEGNRIKPGRTLKCGDRLVIQRGEELYEITVLEVSGRRVSAPLARNMFDENAASQQRREAAAEQLKLKRESGVEPARRPDKRQRRQIIGMIRGKG